MMTSLPQEILQQLQKQPKATYPVDMTDCTPSATSCSMTASSTGSSFNSTSNAPSCNSFSSLSHLTQSNETLNFLLNSTDNLQMPSEAQPSAPSSLTFEELFKQQQLQIQNQQNLLQVLTTKVSSPFSAETDAPSVKTDTPRLENLPTLTKTLAKWGDYNRPHEEIIGQIIQKRSQEKEEYIDVSPYVTFPQHEAARRLGIPSSTLSKKWKDATVNRKWPYRALAKIDKEIATIMHNIPKNPDGTLDPEVEQQLAILLRKREMEARPVIIRLN